MLVRVFWNRTGGLFHPKLSYFERSDGGREVIVGSGNLTPGGLHGNLEAFSILRVTSKEALNLQLWDEFFKSHKKDIRVIDDEALERAAKNVIRGGRRREDVEPDIITSEEDGDETELVEIPRTSTHFLVAQVPAAGNRWDQVHLNSEVVNTFFHVEPNSVQRVYLRERLSSGSLGSQEVRRCLMSKSNKNRRIEVAAAHGIDYPSSGERPVAVFKEIQVRTFEYLLLLPGQDGHAAMVLLTETLPNVGQGLPRVITDSATVEAAWPTCPLCN